MVTPEQNNLRDLSLRYIYDDNCAALLYSKACREDNGSDEAVLSYTSESYI